MHWLVEFFGTVALPAFALIFDQIVEGARTVSLHSSQAMDGATAFHKLIVSALMEEGFPLPHYHFTPHVTIGYGRDGLGSETIVPIHWRVDELLLVESVTGKARHDVHGQWVLTQE